jgi:hypothetical protein
MGGTAVMPGDPGNAGTNGGLRGTWEGRNGGEKVRRAVGGSWSRDDRGIGACFCSVPRLLGRLVSNDSVATAICTFLNLDVHRHRSVMAT